MKIEAFKNDGLILVPTIVIAIDKKELSITAGWLKWVVSFISSRKRKR